MEQIDYFVPKNIRGRSAKPSHLRDAVLWACALLYKKNIEKLQLCQESLVSPSDIH
jgi:hypothetical protein